MRKKKEETTILHKLNNKHYKLNLQYESTFIFCEIIDI